MPGKDPIVLFNGGNDGFGYARHIPGINGFHWCMNWDSRTLGVSVPAMAPILVESSSQHGNAIVAAFEWEDSNNIPILVVAGGDGTAEAIASTLSGVDGDYAHNTQTIDFYTGGVLFRNNTTEMAYFCNGIGNDFLITRNKAGTYATTTEVKADGLFVVGNDLYRTDGFRISKLTADSDPTLSASWGAFSTVGRASYDINAVVSLDGSPFVCKGDGGFVFNPADGSFQIAIPVSSPHPDHGKGAISDGRGRVYFPTADGQLIIARYGFQSQHTPLRGKPITIDTPAGGPITAIATDEEYVLLAVAAGTKKSRHVPGFVVYGWDGAAYDNLTANLTDGLDGTTAAMTNYDGGNRLIFGASEPFAGVSFKLGGVRTAANVSFSVFYYDSGGVARTISFGDSTVRLSQDGVVTFNWGSIGDPTKATNQWTAQATSPLPASKYWAGITLTGDFSAVTIKDVQLIPWRQPLDDSAETTTSWSYMQTGTELAGARAKILVGQWRGEEIVWWDQYSLPVGIVHKMVVSRVTHEEKSTDRTLLCICDYGTVYGLPMGHPVATPYPRLGNYAGTNTVRGEHVLALSGHDFELPWTVKRVQGQVVINFANVQEDDVCNFFYYWDDDAEQVYQSGRLYGSPMTFGPLEGHGVVLHGILLYDDAGRDQVAPTLYSVVIPPSEWEEEGPLNLLKEDQQSPLRR